MRAGFWRLAGWTIAGLLAGGAPAAVASQAQLSYVGYLAGAPVLSLEASITVPEGAKPADGAYFISPDIATLGNLALLYPYTQRLQANGALKGGMAKPSQYQSPMRGLGRQESVILT